MSLSVIERISASRRGPPSPPRGRSSMVIATVRKGVGVWSRAHASREMADASLRHATIVVAIADHHEAMKKKGLYLFGKPLRDAHLARFL